LLLVTVPAGPAAVEEVGLRMPLPPPSIVWPHRHRPVLLRHCPLEHSPSVADHASQVACRWERQ
jgi:hypothetical protein